MSLVETRSDRPFLSYRAPRIAVVERWRVRPMPQAPRVVPKLDAKPAPRRNPVPALFLPPIVIPENPVLAECLASIREAEAEMRPWHYRSVTLADVARVVAERFDVTVMDLKSARRAQRVALPRQVAMFVAKMVTPRSYPEIGRSLGGRDHTTIMHGVRKIEGLRQIDKHLSAEIDAIIAILSPRQREGVSP